jgi:hypothetical protein
MSGCQSLQSVEERMKCGRWEGWKEERERRDEMGEDRKEKRQEKGEERWKGGEGGGR